MGYNPYNFDANALNEFSEEISNLFGEIINNAKQIAACCNEMKDAVSSGDSRLYRSWQEFGINMDVPVKALSQILNTATENIKKYIKFTIANEETFQADIKKLSEYMLDFKSLGQELSSFVNMRYEYGSAPVIQKN